MPFHLNRVTRTGAVANHFSTTDRKQISALFIDLSFQSATNGHPSPRLNYALVKFARVYQPPHALRATP